MVTCNKVIATTTNISVDGREAVIVKPNTTKVSVADTFKITASPRSFYIASQDIFTIQRNADLPQWYLDQLDIAINDSALADEVADLDNRFVNFEDGVTRDIGLLQTEDERLAFDITTIKVSNDTNTAGIQQLNVVKVTEDEARAVSELTIAAWQIGAGGAWFNDQVSVVSNVAFSAAKSASTLTASIDSQQSQLNAIVGDIDVLQSQVDGKVETWFSTDNPVLGDGTINPVIEPYATWLAEDTRAIHTGDTYVYFEFDVVNPTQKNILVTFRFAFDTDTEVYEWYVFEDDLASEALQTALNAQETADGKIITFYQTAPPITNESSLGDLWLDSDNDDKMYRFNGSTWVAVDDKRIIASVNRLDEATVNVDGSAKAKSSLSVNANGVISGFVAESNGETSAFNIFADKFAIVNNENGSFAGAPFSVDTTTNQIKFTGNVSFEGTAVENALQAGQAAQDVNSNVTTINGGKITTNTLNANRIITQSLWTDGSIQSSDYNWNGSVNQQPTGFGLFSGDFGFNSHTYNIVGSRIFGGFIKGSVIEATTLNAVTINTGTLNVDLINGGDITETQFLDITTSTFTNDIAARSNIVNNNSGGISTLYSASIFAQDDGRAKVIDGSGKVMASIRFLGINDDNLNNVISFTDRPRNTSYSLHITVDNEFDDNFSFTVNISVNNFKK